MTDAQGWFKGTEAEKLKNGGDKIKMQIQKNHCTVEFLSIMKMKCH